jgi:hypothetical protein
MKNIMILIATLAMTTMAAQAEQMNASSTDTVMSMSTETPATDTDGDTNGTEQEEVTPEGK